MIKPIIKSDNNSLLKSKCKDVLNLMFKEEWIYEAQSHSKSKEVQITNYLIHGVINSYPINMFPYNRKKLSIDFGCSLMTVSRAINVLKKAKHIKVYPATISLVSSKKEGGAKND